MKKLLVSILLFPLSAAADGVYVTTQYGYSSLPLEKLIERHEVDRFGSDDRASSNSIGIGFKPASWLRAEFVYHDYGHYSATAEKRYTESFTLTCPDVNLCGAQTYTLSAGAVLQGRAEATVKAYSVRLIPEYNVGQHWRVFGLVASGKYDAKYQYTLYVPLSVDGEQYEVAKHSTQRENGSYLYAGAGIGYKKVSIEGTGPYPRTIGLSFRTEF